MKKYAITKTCAFFIVFVFTLCLQNNYAQCSAGGPETKTISYPFSTENLNDLFSGGTNCSTTMWSLKSGPIGPRGPRIPKVSVNDDVDFPNTGGGQDYEYVYEFKVTDGAFQETANKTCFIDLIGERSSEEQIIYICPGEAIADENELLNAFSLDQVRDTDNTWYQDVNYVGSDFIDEANYYLDNETLKITFAPNGIGAGNYIQYGFSSNRLKATVQEIGRSEKNVQFSFANAQNTNDGPNDYFEVDVMIQTTDAGDSFKLGNGKLIFKYNNAAFGNFINAYSNEELVTAPTGYILSQTTSSGNNPIYSSIEVLDNTNDVVNYEDLDNSSNIYRFSLGFTQIESATEIAADNVTNTPSKLCHIKIKYADNPLDPMLTFEGGEDGSIYDNKFTDADQINLIVNDVFDNSGATFSNSDFELLSDILLYPNPTKDVLLIKGDISKINAIEIYSITGREILKMNNKFKSINISKLQAGVYFVKLKSENASKTIKIIKE